MSRWAGCTAVFRRPAFASFLQKRGMVLWRGRVVAGKQEQQFLKKNYF
jgi:hypothetical protein